MARPDPVEMTINSMKTLANILLIICLVQKLHAQEVNKPAPRVGATLLYHAKLNRVIMLDGLMKEPINELTRIWAWDGTK